MSYTQSAEQAIAIASLPPGEYNVDFWRSWGLSRHTGTEPVHKWYVMAAVAVGIFLATIDASIVNIALPVLEQDLHTDFAIVEWVVLAYMVTIVTLMLATVPVAVAAVAPRAGALSDRFGTRPLTALGLGILVVGYAAASTLGLGTSALGYVLRFLPVGIGIGCFQSPNNSAIMGAVPRERLGVASGLLSLTRTLGQTVGIAVIGALWSTRVFAYTDDATLPDASAAPASVQVAALNQTLRVTVGLVVIALGLSLWALRQERRMRTAGRTAPHS